MIRYEFSQNDPMLKRANFLKINFHWAITSDKQQKGYNNKKYAIPNSDFEETNV